MATMEQQMELDIDVETFSKRERYLIKRLREFRTIDVDISVQKRLMDGIGLIHEPRITAAPQERDYMSWLCRVGYDVSEGEQAIIEAMKRHLNQADFATWQPDTKKLRLDYATPNRVARQIDSIEVEDQNDRILLDLAKMVLTDRKQEEYLHLMDIERVADKRLQERERATNIYKVLCERKQIISEALSNMDQYFHEQYVILWHKFVLGERWQKVCRIAGRDGADLTPDEYRWSRKKALRQFDKWAKGI